MMKITTITISILLVLVSLSCEKKEAEPQAQDVHSEHPLPSQQSAPEPLRPAAPAAMVTGVVEEVLQANAYTYLKVKAGDKDMWIAVTKRETKVGETVSFAPGLEMPNFKSKDLQRTFQSVYFVNSIVGGGPTAPAAHEAPHRMKPTLEMQEVSVEPAEGGVTIGQLFSDRDSHADKTVLIRGQVTKVNRAIMAKNWVHIQDGTSDSGKFDLTITTQEQVNVGDVVTFEGKIVLNKDFGAGYAYDVLMEDARLKTE
ncbi:MAG: hypothetical protein JSW27_01075 [Phycisphaerales bacterium]|nr:MAG: hypothetical protein JSW27_01075 [Phycisphaerales bacterium]